MKNYYQETHRYIQQLYFLSLKEEKRTTMQINEKCGKRRKNTRAARTVH